MHAVTHVLDQTPRPVHVEHQSFILNGQLSDHMVLVLSNVEPEFKLASVLVLLVTHVVIHVLVQTLDQEHVEHQLFTLDGLILDHMVLAQSNVVPEFKLANVLVLLVTHVVIHVLGQILDQEPVEPLSFTLNGQHSDHTVLVQSNVEQEHKLANVLVLLVTPVVIHVLDLILDREHAVHQLFTQNGLHSDHSVLAL